MNFYRAFLLFAAKHAEVRHIIRHIFAVNKNSFSPLW